MPRIFEIFSKNTEKIEEKNNENLKIVADIREKNSLLISELISHSVQVEFENLEVADFIVKDVAIERKTVSDFLSSMISKRLSQQLTNMKNYEKSLLIIEGIDEKTLYPLIHEDGGINPNAVRGFLLDIIFKYRVPVIFTKNFEDTSKFLIVLAKKQDKEMPMRAKRIPKNAEEQKQFILEGFPGIGPKTAKKLIEKFGSIKSITNAQDEELKKILGKKTANFLQIINR